MTVRRSTTVCAILAAALASCGGAADPVIATVNGQSITRAQLDRRIESTPAARGAAQQIVLNDLLEQYAASHRIFVTPSDIESWKIATKRNIPAINGMRC